MIRTMIVVASLAMLFVQGGCKSNHAGKNTASPSPSTPPPQSLPAETPAAVSASKPDDTQGEIRAGGEQYSGPPAKVNVLQLESFPVQYSASVEITTPTGGWVLELDRGEIVDGTARVYLTLERPGEGELVTQSLVKHTKAYTSTTPFKRAAVYIHLAQRDVSTFTTNYRLAASSD